MTAREKFQIGDRVRRIGSFGRTGRAHKRETEEGIVTGFGQRNDISIRVRSGTAQPTTWNMDYWEHCDDTIS